MKNLFDTKIFSFFTTVPSKITSERVSFFTAIVIGFVIAIVYHIGLVVFWYFVDVPEMVIYHFLGFPLLFTGLMVTKAGYPRIGLLLGTIEYILHGVLGTIYIGWLSGMHFPIPTAAVIWTIIPGRKKPLNRIVPVATIVLYGLLAFFSVSMDPQYQLPSNILQWTSVIMAFTNFGLLICLFAYNALATSWYESLQLEREKSEHLLLNVLPAKIALRLKEKEGVIADRFDSVSVLFLDIVNFTKMSSDMAANKIVGILNKIFCLFDNLTEKHGLEKIKTIGDAYMVVSGIPEPVSDHARRIIGMAVDMLTILEDYSNNSDHNIKARIGICSGPVVAGVIGRRKFIYDLWGDTVNTASRMESNGIPNRIQVTQSTYEILRHDYEFESRGEIMIKGKGKMKTYFLKPEAEHAIRKSMKELTDMQNIDQACGMSKDNNIPGIN